MHKQAKVIHQNSGGAVYSLGVIGALIYYIQNANSLTDFLIGAIKAIFWPGFVVYEILTVFQM